jgi:hypothetical protein
MRSRDKIHDTGSIWGAVSGQQLRRFGQACPILRSRELNAPRNLIRKTSDLALKNEPALGALGKAPQRFRAQLRHARFQCSASTRLQSVHKPLSKDVALGVATEANPNVLNDLISMVDKLEFANDGNRIPCCCKPNSARDLSCELNIR